MVELNTREQVRGYLNGVAKELESSLGSLAVASELDLRDPLADFRGKFEVPTVGELMEGEEGTTEEIDQGTQPCN